MSAGTKGSAAAATGFSFDAGRPFPPLAFLPGAGAGWRPVGRPGRCDARKSLKNKASGSPDDRVLKIFHKIWKSGQVDCDWFSNELLPPPNLPDRHASSGGCFRDGRGFGAAEARGTARWRKPPGADHFPDFGPHDGGNGREGLAITAERGRGGLGRGTPGRAPSVSGPVARVRRTTAGGPRKAPDPTLFQVVGSRSIQAPPGSGDPGALKTTAPLPPPTHCRFYTKTGTDDPGGSGAVPVFCFSRWPALPLFAIGQGRERRSAGRSGDSPLVHGHSSQDQMAA